ncbi:MAG: hypothetical protein ACRDMH_07100 [Solirubrobacterales bacterium]
MARRRKEAPWFHEFLTRLRFEEAARKEYPSLQGMKAGKGKNAEIIYVIPVTLPIYGIQRTITISLANYTEPAFIGVTVDGPTDSPHRYGSGNLCMWHPGASWDARWTADEGLLGLIQYARIHLFREEYWRETGGRDGGIWAGSETPHGEIKEEAA